MEWRGDDIDEESVVEPGEEEAGDERAEARVKKLREEIERLRKEKQEYMDGWQRAKADYVNALRRFEEEKKAERGRGVEKAAETLLPAFDALERAKEHGEIPAGFEAIAKQLASAFKELGLEPVGAVGEPFDPAIHEAYGQDSTDDAGQDDTVSAILEKGYRLGGRTIRPAKVRIYRTD
ncbi:MAG: nucleotide exchange factor GrpE [Patescibacteria group bacterium]|nr:nucleotide exchange factor GrpE [Patescibacteria group bacterium]MDE2057545.1 nucleotide exchange factor GrpE [Patescibacteria group bacterium]